MIAFPNAKINLGLNITAKRSDGYHNISSCFLPIGWKDALEVISSDTFEFRSTGIAIPGDSSQNLCVKAYELLKVDFDIRPVKIHLHKVIPMGAGLGGGSSDGAFCLKLLNDLFELKISIEKLESYAIALGADCPFFIQNKPRLVSGIGDKFNDIDLDLSELQLLVVHPNIHVNTGIAFSKMKPKMPNLSVQEILSQSRDSWRENLVNDFEIPVFEMHPEIQNIKKRLIDCNPVYCSMSGSGSSVYAIFENTPSIERLNLSEDYSYWLGPLSF
ncbi:MAG: 4-(cytidine 5'-diphospho)-2-C-methyl-D-erythritol kinase [Reichenbachiella sp.]